MRAELTVILDEHRPTLVKQLDVNGGILNRLLAKGVITDDHLEDIKAEKTPRKQSEMLLDKLKTRDDKYYAIFRCEVEKEQKQLAVEHLPLTDDALPYPKEEQTPKSS